MVMHISRVPYHATYPFHEQEHDSNDEGYDGNDYPDDQSFDGEDDPFQNGGKFSKDVFGGVDSDCDDYFDADDHRHNGEVYDSDEDSEDDWKTDFRNRFIPKQDLKHSSTNVDDDELENEFSPFNTRGFDTSRREHGWDYTANTWANSMGSDGGESDCDYAGPMCTETEGMEDWDKIAYDSNYDDQLLIHYILMLQNL